MKTLLAIMDKGKSGAEVRATVDKKLQAIDAQIKNLNYIKKTLNELHQLCDGAMSISECPIISKLHSGKP